jgi:UDP-glucose 4-epimerase
MKAIVTGGAGLVGSTLCQVLLDKGASVLCLDNLTLGTERHIEELRSREGFEFETWDVSLREWWHKLKGRSFDLIVHLAANSDISLGHRHPEMDYQRTLVTTFECLCAARELQVANFLFSSTSAVYGANPALPTPEQTSGMHPVSIYGAGKLAAEAFISAFVENYGLASWVYRFGNVVGKKLTHGVIFDFTRRLRENPSELTVLGNGQQTKTYIDVRDCVDGMLHGFEKSPAGETHAQRFQVFNLSTEGTTSVKQIAEEACKVVASGRTKITYGDSPIGWVGDVPRTHLSVARMHALGWQPKRESTQAVFEAIRDHHEWTG